MIARYRDGGVPAVDVDPALREDFDGLAERVAERSTAPSSPRRSTRSGGACGG